VGGGNRPAHAPADGRSGCGPPETTLRPGPGTGIAIPADDLPGQPARPGCRQGRSGQLPSRRRGSVSAVECRSVVLEAECREGGMTTFCAVSGKPTPAWSDQDLVGECLGGNEQAWAALVEKYKGLVYSAPFRYRMTPQDAADIFQEVWFDLYSELPNLRQPGAIRGWLIKAAWHKCYHWKQRQRRSERATGEFDAEPVDGEASFPEWKEQMER